MIRATYLGLSVLFLSLGYTWLRHGRVFAGVSCVMAGFCFFATGLIVRPDRGGLR